jgi:hypothetical protein
VSGGDSRPPHRLRSEKPHRRLGRRGFESRHLHNLSPADPGAEQQTPGFSLSGLPT